MNLTATQLIGIAIGLIAIIGGIFAGPALFQYVQDSNAQGDLKSIASAEANYFGMHQTFADKATLSADKATKVVTGQNTKWAISSSDQGYCIVGQSTAGTGTTFYQSSEQPETASKLSDLKLPAGVTCPTL